MAKEAAINITFEKAFKFPFNRPEGLLNILWVLLPIIGWLALFGYNMTKYEACSVLA